MAKKSSEMTSRGSNDDRSVRPFGADYVTPSKRGHVDLKAHPNVMAKDLVKDDYDRSVRPFGADYVTPSKRGHVDLKARPDLVRGQLGDVDFSAQPDDQQ